VPVRLEVANLEIAMDVTPVGAEDDGVMALPRSVTEAGWYEFGPRPVDSAGATVLAAHVDSAREGLGPFARLRSVRPGAVVTLLTRDRTRYRYRVDSVDVVNKDQVPLSEVFDREGAPRLVLVTCGGAYDRGTGYRANVLVTASPMSAERP
jgi:LPXTG-site transpeptidase (sortase) family protein